VPFLTEAQRSVNRHDATGLIHFGARYYDPSTARWTQVDPAGQGLNLYLYAAANPVNETDPTGLYRISRNWWGFRFYFTHYDTFQLLIHGVQALFVLGVIAVLFGVLAYCCGPWWVIGDAIVGLLAVILTYDLAVIGLLDSYHGNGVWIDISWQNINGRSWWNWAGCYTCSWGEAIVV